MLTVKNVTKKYGDFTALEDIELEFESGIYALLAPNGAGKTTLIKMLVTLLFPTKGEILYNGTDIYKLDEEYRELIGFLPQEFGYYKSYTPKAYLSYLCALKGIPKKDTNKRIGEVLEMVSMTEHANKKMKKFSGGMIQRIGIAQAMLNDPKVLVLDEPTAGLDPKERVRFRNILSNLARDRIIILSTHIVSDIETIASKVIMLKSHKLFCDCSVADACKPLEGRLFEIGNKIKLSEKDIFLSERQDADETVQRFVSDAPPVSAVPVAPGLEDVFLYLYRDEVG